MEKLILLPDADGYSSTDGSEVVATKLDGGEARYRRDKIGATSTVNVTWTLNPGQYQYWRAFYNTATGRGALPFLCDLVSDDGCGPVERQCSFVPGSVTMPTQRGLVYIQQATLEVAPFPLDPDADEAVIDLYGTGDPFGVLLSLDLLVNTSFPENIGA